MLTSVNHQRIKIAVFFKCMYQRSNLYKIWPGPTYTNDFNHVFFLSKLESSVHCLTNFHYKKHRRRKESLRLRHLTLQHHHCRVAGFAVAGFVDGNDAVFQFLAAGLLDQCRFADYRGRNLFPSSGGTFSALDLVGTGFAAFDRRFPV